MNTRPLLFSMALLIAAALGTNHRASANETPVEDISKAAAEGEVPCVELIRSIPAGNYVPGEPLKVVLRVEAACSGPITSFGISEQIPRNWTLTDVEAITGSKPNTRIDQGILEFVWVSVPAFPIEFQYTLTPSEVEGGTLEFSGNAFYYIDMENTLRNSATVVTTVEPITQNEGEVLAEGESEGEVAAEGEQEGEPEAPVGCCRVVSTADNRARRQTMTARFAEDGFLITLVGLDLRLNRF